MDWKLIVRQAQAKTGFTQQVLAKQLGCSQASISGLERGRTREPRYSIGQKLLVLAGYQITAPDMTQLHSISVQAAAAAQGA